MSEHGRWIEISGPSLLGGGYRAAYAPVFEAFRRNFDDGELGAAVSAVQDGELVVDIWGGHRDPDHKLRWERDTTVCMMSVAKVFSALSMHILADRGVVDLDAPVSRYWPEFARNGKESVLLRWVLCHLAGVPVIDNAPRGAIYDWNAMTGGLVAQKPLWEPGTTRCYHTCTQGFILGEIVRRVTGKTIGAFIRDEIAGPLGIDYAIGLDAAQAARCAMMIPSKGVTLTRAQEGDGTGMLARGWGQLPVHEDFNSPAWRSSEIPSVNGHGTARAVARFCGALARGGEIDGVRIISLASLERAITEQWAGADLMSGLTFRIALGFFLNCPPDRPMGPNPPTFGHSGAGGAQSFADPVLRLGFAYAPNRMHGGMDNGPRGTRLIDAVFGCATAS
jgi:CubicO group peptidase (beta-lactamase class C family)